MADLSRKDIDSLTDAIRNLTKELTRGSSAISSTTTTSAATKTKRPDNSTKQTAKSLDKLAAQFAVLSETLKDTIKNNKDAEKATADTADALQSFSKNLTRQDLSKIIARASAQAAAGISSGASDSISDARQQLVTLSKQLGAMGVLGEDFTKKFGSIKHLSTKDVPAFSKALQDAMLSAGLYAKHSNKAVAAFDKLHSGVVKTSNVMTAVMTSPILEGMSDINKQLQSFNIAGVGDSFMHVHEMSVRMGMSFSDTVAFMKSNNRMLAKLGPSGMQLQMAAMKDAFVKFGYTMEQGAKLVGPAVQAGISAGIDVSGSGLTRFINTSMTAFQRIQGITNVTAEQFLKLNQELFSAEGTFENMMGMDKERRFAYQQDLMQTRERYMLGGMTIEQANEMLRLQNQQKRESVSTRNKSAAMMMMRAQMAGQSPQEAMRAFVLGRKGIRTKEEDIELQAIQARTAQGMQQRRQAEGDITGDTVMTDVFDEKTRAGLSSSAQAVEKLGLQGKAAADAGQKVTEGDRARSAQLAKGSESLAAFGNAVNTASSLLNNEFLAALKKIIAGVGGVATSIVGGVAGGAVGGAVTAAATKAVAGAAAKAAGTAAATAAGTTAAGTAAAGTAAAAAATTAAVTAGVVAGTTGAYAIVQGIRGEDASNWASRASESVGLQEKLVSGLEWLTGQDKKNEAAGKAAIASTPVKAKTPPVAQPVAKAAPTTPETPAPIAPVSPPMPAIVAPSSMVQPATAAATAAVNSKSTLDAKQTLLDQKAINVSDETAANKLSALIENMVQAVSYLKTISEKQFITETPESGSMLSSNVSSTRSFLTGRY